MWLRRVLLLAGLSMCVHGHGRLIDPPSRSTMWRFGYNTEKNYNDNQLFCGGFSIQWSQNGGKCGVCGDNYADNPRENEAPNGKYAKGVIVRKYDVGQTVEIKVHITANHKGWFEYRLCQNNDPKAAVTQECFDKNLLTDEAGKETRFTITQTMFHIKHVVKLPDGVNCRACVLQWKYNTGNSWGVDETTKKGCIGCGPQEQFYGCADIAIGADDVELGSPNQPVEIPDGDVDERKMIEKTDEYDNTGTCVCNCAQTSAATKRVSVTSIFVVFCLAFLQTLYTSKIY